MSAFIDANKERSVNDQSTLDAVSTTTAIPAVVIYDPIEPTLPDIEMDVTAGEHLALLTPTGDQARYTPEVLADLVSAWDKAWEFYAQTTGREPSLFKNVEGLGTVAVVPETCGAGCGYLGATGIEILDEPYFNQYTHDGLADLGQYNQIVFYELGRNFFFYFDQFNGFDELTRGHMTTGFAVANEFLSMQAANVEGAPFLTASQGLVSGERLEMSIMHDLAQAYFDDPSLNWSNTVLDGKAPVTPFNWDLAAFAGSLFGRFHEDFGPSAYAAMWQEIGDAPKTMTPGEATATIIDAMSAVSGVNHDFMLKEGGEIFVVGDAGANTLDMSSEPVTATVVALGFDGEDVIHGRDADDLMIGGSGNDDLFGKAGADILIGSEGDDDLFGGSDNDRLFGGPGFDIMAGDGGDDQIDGGIGDTDGNIAVFSGKIADYTFSLQGGDPFESGLLVVDERGIDGTDTVVRVETLRFLDGDIKVNALPTDINYIAATPPSEQHFGTDAVDVFVFEPGDSTPSALDSIFEFKAGDRIDLSAFGFTGTKDSSYWDPNLLTIEQFGNAVGMWDGRGADGFQLIVRGAFDDVLAGLILDDPNTPPVAANDIAETLQGLAVEIDVLDNDSDPDGDPLSIASFGQAVNGTVTATPGGLTYEPSISFTGTDSFAYTVSDGYGGLDTALVEVTVAPRTDINIVEATSASEVHVGTTEVDVFVFEPGDSTPTSLDYVRGLESVDRIDLSAFGFTGVKDTSYWDPTQLTVKELGSQVAMWGGHGPDTFQLIVVGDLYATLDGLILGTTDLL